MSGSPQQAPDPAPDEIRTLMDRAAADALARARAGAQARGLRPGRVRRSADRSTATERGGSGDAGSRDPLPLGSIVDSLTTHRGWDTDLAVGSIMGRWPAIVGLDVARHCRPERFDRGVLTIRAESTAWAAQLRAFSATVRDLVEAEVGPGLVMELRILGPGGPSWRRGPLRVQGRGPRDTYG